jgi:hypothetical protein
MTKRLIIHIGPHKTGTTAIQKMLYTHSRSEASGFIYPFTDADRLGQHAFADVIHKADRQGLTALASELMSSDKTCVLSSEEFCYLPPDRLRALKDYLTDTDITIVYYARNVLTTLHPWWQEQVKHGNSQTFLEFALGCLVRPGSIHLLIPDVMLSNWACVFGQEAIKIYLYDDIADVANQFAADLLDVTLPPDHFTETNISYDYIEAEMIRFWNMLGARGADLIQLPQALELSVDIGREARASSKQFNLSYQIPSLSMIEDILLERWRDQIQGSVDPHLFKTRDRSYPYVHPDFWVARPDLVARMRAFVTGSSLAHQ